MESDPQPESRRVGWRGLGMAGGRRSHGQGTFWGDLIGPNPTDRGKAGTKRSLLVDGEGGPLSIVVAGANVHDAKLLEATLDAIVVERPQPTEEEPQHLCLDMSFLAGSWPFYPTSFRRHRSPKRPPRQRPESRRPLLDPSSMDARPSISPGVGRGGPNLSE